MTIVSTVKPLPSDPYKIFPLDHSWDSPFTSSYEYKTDIMLSANGKEQRRAVRFQPRRTFEMSCNYWGDAKFLFDQFMATWLDKVCYVQEENLCDYLLSPMGAGDTSVTIRGEVQPWMVEGRVVIISDKSRKETRTIQSAGGSSITFSDDVEDNTTTFPRGAKITAACLAKIDLNPKATRLTNTKGQIQVRANIEPGTEVIEDNPDGAFYIGLREFLYERNNWGDSPEIDFVSRRLTFDAGYGRTSSVTPIKFPGRTTKFGFVGKTAAQASMYIDFFIRHKGRNREFLSQTYEADIPYVATAAGSNTLFVEGQGFALAYKDSTVFRRLMIKPRVGEPIHRQIETIVYLPDSDLSVIVLTEDLPFQNLAPDAIFMCSWVTVSRFATDRLDVEWLTNGVARFSLSMQTLENFDV